jgi:hypothetical protein
MLSFDAHQRLIGVLALGISNGQITAISSINNPYKLASKRASDAAASGLRVATSRRPDCGRETAARGTQPATPPRP